MAPLPSQERDSVRRPKHDLQHTGLSWMVMAANSFILEAKTTHALVSTYFFSLFAITDTETQTFIVKFKKYDKDILSESVVFK